MENKQKIRVRFAPSPTGYLHIGGLRSALYNYLFARQNDGDFILRIEDTDRNRYVMDATENLISSLRWAGLEWNEGPKLNDAQELAEEGKFGPYIQSERLDIYKEYVHKLVKEGKAYYCFCEPERLESMREEQRKKKQAPMYDRYCLMNVKEEEISRRLRDECPATVRLKIPKDEVTEYQDVIRGRVTFKTNTIDDQVLLKSDGFPTYHLANVIDDHLMEISHVIRGEEWVPSTPKHIVLYRALGWEEPKFAHLPLLLNPDKSKLSKRQGDVAVEDYAKKGYLPEALLNFTALLGWNPGKGSEQEIFSLSELVEKFDLERVHKAGAVFDIKKLDWINAQYIKAMSIDELYDRALPFFQQQDFYSQASEAKKSKEYIKKVLNIERDRLERLDEVGANHQFFFVDKPEYNEDMLLWKDMDRENLVHNLTRAQKMLEEIVEKEWERKERLEEIFLTEAGEKRGEFLWPLRVALTGQQKSPPPHEVSWVIGKHESIDRVKKALRKIS